MIHIHMPSLIPPKLPYKQIQHYPLVSSPINLTSKNNDIAPTPGNNVKSIISGMQASLFLAAANRDRIIKKCVTQSGFKEGDVVVLAVGTKEEIDARGPMTIERICRSYTDYGKDTEWPVHDRPFILLVGWEKEGKKLYMYCSVDLVTKKEQENV